MLFRFSQSHAKVDIVGGTVQGFDPGATVRGNAHFCLFRCESYATVVIIIVYKNYPKVCTFEQSNLTSTSTISTQWRHIYSVYFLAISVIKQRYQMPDQFARADEDPT